MPTNRTAYRYHFKRGNKILHTGITNNLERKEFELQQEYGEGTHIKQVGLRTTVESAFHWKEEQRKRGKQTD